MSMTKPVEWAPVVGGLGHSLDAPESQSIALCGPFERASDLAPHCAASQPADWLRRWSSGSLDPSRKPT